MLNFVFFSIVLNVLFMQAFENEISFAMIGYLYIDINIDIMSIYRLLIIDILWLVGLSRLLSILALGGF
jgi:hypothetical protein